MYSRVYIKIENYKKYELILLLHTYENTRKSKIFELSFFIKNEKTQNSNKFG